MPLSEEEQRILHEIERQFYEHDPAFARQVGATTLAARSGRNLKLSVLTFVGGLALMLVSFASSLILGVLGFAVMFLSAVVFERNLRRMRRSGWPSMGAGGAAAPGAAFKGAVGDARKRLRDRFRRDDD